MQAGTKIKQIFNRLVASEKTAKSLFNQAMETSQVLTDKGDILQYTDVSDLAKKDLPKALELMSKLYIEGKLTDEVMQKMFTARHFREASELFIQMGGNVESFTRSITSGVSYLNDYEKKLFDVNEQMKILKNTFMNIAKGSFQFAAEGFTGLSAFLSEYMNNSVVNQVASFGANIASLSTAFITLHASISLFKAGADKYKIFLGMSKDASRLQNLLNVIKLPTSQITLVIGALALMGKAYNDMRRDIIDFRKSVIDLITTQEKLKNQSESLTNRLTLVDEKFESLQDKNLAKNFKDIDDSAKYLIETLDESIPALKTLISSLRELQDIQVNPLSQVTETLRGDIKTRISEYKELMDEFSPEKINEKITQAYRLYQTSSPTRSGMIDDSELETIKADFNKYFEIAKKYKTGSKEYKEALEEQGLTTRKLYTLSKVMGEDSLDSLMKKYKDVDKLRKDEEAELKKLQEEYRKYQDAVDKVNTSLQKTFDKSRLRMLQDFGQITINVDGVEETFKGIDAYQKLYSESYKNDLTNLIDTYKSKLESLNKIDQKERTKLQESQINSLEKTIANLKKGFGADLFEGSDVIVDISSSKLKMYAQEIYSLTKEINLERAKGTETSKKIIDSAKRIKEETEKIYRKELEAERARDKATFYKLKYKDIGKEDLSVSLELSKLGKTAIEQERLKYEYKLKGYELDKQFASLDLTRLQSQMKSIVGDKALTFKGFTKEDLLNIHSTKDAQKIQKSLMENYPVQELKGESGKVIEAISKLLIDIAQSYLKIESYSNKALTEPLSRYNKSLMESHELLKTTIDLETKLYNITGTSKKLSLINSDILSTQKQISKEYNKSKLTNVLGDLDFNNLQAFSGDLSLEIEERKLDLQEKGSNVSKKDRETYVKLVELRKKLNSLLTKEVEKQKMAYDLDLKRAEVWDKMGNTFSKLGDITGMESLGRVGESLSGFGDFFKQMKDPSQKFSFEKILDFDGFKNQTDEWASNFSNMLSGAMSGMAMGGSIGGMLFNNQSAQAGGSLGGAIAGAGAGDALAGLMGMSAAAGPAVGAAIAVGGALLGEAFKGDDQTEEAAKYSAEQKKIYDKNTEALQQLSTRMSNLLTGLGTLNNSLLTTAGKIPTITNIGNMTDAMKQMNETLIKQREFDSVSYQVTHKKSGHSGFMGIGSTPDTYWTETIKMNVDDLLRKYGFYGDIKQMSSDQLRAFSDWLKEYDLGETDNFTLLADAVENYAQAVDKMNKDITTIFYDSTMESFVGIASVEKEQLRTQLENFYKNLGIQIDKQMSAQIDNMIEEMSAMVTITQDVRNEFVNSWAESGTSAGKGFVKSMSSYIKAMSTNVSQIFYDVFYSDINKQLDTQFKDFSESLVELKKQGEELKWTDVTDELKKSFEGVVTTIVNAKQESTNFSETIRDLQDIALESGLKLGDLISMGLATSTQKSLMDTFTTALTGTEMDSGLYSIGDFMGNKIGDALSEQLINKMYDNTILELGDKLDKVISGTLDFSNIIGLVNDAMSIGVSAETERRKIEALTSAFDFSQEITYEKQDSNIKYETGVSSNINNYYYLTTKVDAGNVIESDSLDDLVERTMNLMVEKFKEEKGVDLLNTSF